MTHLIGIDLGTTNCTLSYIDLEGKKEKIERLSIPQMMELNREGEADLLSSFLYYPLEGEVEQGTSFLIGQYAKERGGEVPDRLVHSAKSWLSHVSVDRREKILPPELKAISPVEASTEILSYLKKAWDKKFPEAPFQEQTVMITVPASFDPSARQLVEEAAQAAGYPEIRLIEEPLAAFYAWLHHTGEEWRNQLSVGDKLLVVDVGGGTSDFTLISVDESEGSLELNRIAVGSHLLLGGDNLDMAIAYMAKALFEKEGTQVDEWQMQELVHASRKAKESIFSNQPPEKLSLTVQGRGSSLIGGQITTELDADEVRNAVLEGFFPVLPASEQSAAKSFSGIQTVGLPYAQDPRISCQLSKFLSMTGEQDTGSTEQFVHPTAVLFNGGTFKAAQFRERVVDLLDHWSHQEVKVLEHQTLDHAVSIGAAYYGLVREGRGIRVKGGTSRSYYIGVEESAPAVPGIPAPMNAVCIVPFGMEEGTEEGLEDREFALVLGETAKFRFFSHNTPALSDGGAPGVGAVVRNWQKELTELHPIETLLEKKEGDSQLIRVKLKSRVTELGVLELLCTANDGREWKLEFDIRQDKKSIPNFS